MTIKELTRAGFSLGSRGKTGSRTLINQPYQIDDEQEQFEALLEQLGVKDLVCTGGNDEALRAMWENLTSDPNPEMMAAFEEVLGKLTGDLQRKSAEREDLETTFKIRNKAQEKHLQHLYEEMEQQIQRQDITSQFFCKFLSQISFANLNKYKLCFIILCPPRFWLAIMANLKNEFRLC